MMVGYNWRSFHNLSNPEVMDAAQVGRNLAVGRGYTTQFIRPFSIYLINKRNQARYGNGSAEVAADPAQLKGTHPEGLHPDLANPPVYPLVLAGLMKGLPFNYPVNVQDAFWSVPARQTMDSRFLSQWVRSGEHSWASCILESLLRNYIPASFPLRAAPQGLFPEQLFLTDHERWATANP